MAEENEQVITVLKPHANILAFYSGRDAGLKYMPQRNWVDEGALSVGIANYAIVSGDEALVYDTHVSVAHGRAVRRILEAQGVRRIKVLLSHWHLDHIAGSEAFQDCDIWANSKTDELLRRNRVAIETGTCDGPPAITPLVLPTHTYEGEMRIKIGDVSLRIIEANIHSPDASAKCEQTESSAKRNLRELIDFRATYLTFDGSIKSQVALVSFFLKITRSCLWAMPLRTL